MLKGFGETDYDYYDDTNPDVESKIPVAASKIPAGVIRQPPGAGFGGPDDFGETNAVVSFIFKRVIYNCMNEFLKCGMTILK